MSKSYNNTIPLFDDPRKLRKRIMGINTDSKTLEDPKDPDNCAVFDLFRLFADEAQQQELASRYRAGGMGYGDAKQALFDAAMHYFGPSFERRARLQESPDDVEDILRQGARRARTKAQEVVERVRSACGLSARPC